MQLDFALVDNEELGAEVADAGANLPSGERILVGRVVADEKNRFGMVKLIHGQQGISSVFTQRGDQASVICGAMVIDVVGAEGGAGQALEEIVLFVGGAVRADEAERIRPVFGVNFF